MKPLLFSLLCLFGCTSPYDPPPTKSPEQIRLEQRDAAVRSRFEGVSDTYNQDQLDRDIRKSMSEREPEWASREKAYKVLFSKKDSLKTRQ